jgi:transposase
MKKVSTVAAKPNRNFSQQKLTIGLDLGDRSSWYCVLDEAGSMVLESRRGRVRREGTSGRRGDRA